jgi:hypothetical protein
LSIAAAALSSGLGHKQLVIVIFRNAIVVTRGKRSQRTRLKTLLTSNFLLLFFFFFFFPPNPNQVASCNRRPRKSKGKKLVHGSALLGSPVVTAAAAFPFEVEQRSSFELTKGRMKRWASSSNPNPVCEAHPAAMLLQTPISPQVNITQTKFSCKEELPPRHICFWVRRG